VPALLLVLVLVCPRRRKSRRPLRCRRRPCGGGAASAAEARARAAAATVQRGVPTAQEVPAAQHPGGRRPAQQHVDQPSEPAFAAAGRALQPPREPAVGAAAVAPAGPAALSPRLDAERAHRQQQGEHEERVPGQAHPQPSAAASAVGPGGRGLAGTAHVRETGGGGGRGCRHLATAAAVEAHSGAGGADEAVILFVLGRFKDVSAGGCGGGRGVLVFNDGLVAAVGGAAAESLHEDAAPARVQRHPHRGLRVGRLGDRGNTPSEGGWVHLSTNSFCSGFNRLLLEDSYTAAAATTSETY